MEDTIFHKIIRREIPAEIVREDDELIAIRDINPVAPVHVLVIPKKTIPGISSAAQGDAELLGKLLLTAKELATQLGVADTGYRLVVNNGWHAQQTVNQLHIHLIGGRQFSWPPG
jgi:histidine triad (HIT) family protein